MEIKVGDVVKVIYDHTSFILRVTRIIDTDGQGLLGYGLHGIPLKVYGDLYDCLAIGKEYDGDGSFFSFKSCEVLEPKDYVMELL